MSFRIQGLPAERFAHLFDMSEQELSEHGAVRQIATDRSHRAMLGQFLF